MDYSIEIQINEQLGWIILIGLVATTDVPPSCTTNPSTTVGFQTPTEGNPTELYKTPIGSARLNRIYFILVTSHIQKIH